MKRWSRAVLLVLCVTLGNVLSVSPAHAHGLVAGGSQVLEVQAGAYPLRIEAIVPVGAPTQLTLKVLPLHSLSAPAQVTVVAHHSATDYRSTPYTTRLDAGQPLIAFFDIAIPTVGAWDLALTYEIPGTPAGLVVVPVTIAPVVTPPLTIPLFIGFGLLALTLSVSILWLTAPAWVRIFNGYAFVGILSGVTVLAALSAWPNVKLEDTRTTPALNPLPYLTMRSEVQVEASDAYLVLQLYDGSTGLPADDLVLHHQALMHLVMVSNDNTQLFHLHPARVAPGVYRIVLRDVPAGEYELAVEVERINSGSQVLRGQYTLSDSQATAPPALGPVQLQERTQVAVGEYQVDVRLREPAQASVANVMTVAVFHGGQPVEALDYWLGMLGHMLIRSQDGGVFGHVHAASAMNSDFQPASVRGHEVSFVYSFPYPDTYTIWIQLQVRGEILTIPLKVTVTP